MEYAICPVCGKEFQKKEGSWKIYCSKECQGKHGRDKASIPRCRECKEMLCGLRDMALRSSPLACPKRYHRKHKEKKLKNGGGRLISSRRMEPGEDEVIRMRSRHMPEWDWFKPGYMYTSLCPDPEYRR